MDRWCLLVVFSVYSVVCSALVHSAPQAKLSREELALRQQNAGDDPIRLLELCPLADDAGAQKLRGLASKLLLQAAAADHAELARKLALVLADAARTPDEVHQILGPPQKVSRQIVYRRCLEQWTYDQTVALCLTWVIPHGEGACLKSVRSSDKKN